MGNVLRRLRRLCRFYGSDPQFLCSSATIKNPAELATALTGKPVEWIQESGAPRGDRYFAIYNPPVVNRQLGIRKSALGSARDSSAKFLEKGLQTIVFAPSRLATEVLVTYLKDMFESKPGSEGVIRGYRGGYLPLKRREIERGLRDGSVLRVVSTNALELGIDIGALDVSVMLSYPGTVASTWQQAGRSGRRRSTSAAVLVLNSTPLNQFIGRNPDPDNLHILISHIKCAAFELPIESDETFGSENLVEILGFLETQGFVHKAGDSWQRRAVRWEARSGSQGEREAHPRGVGRLRLSRRHRLAALRQCVILTRHERPKRPQISAEAGRPFSIGPRPMR